MLSRLLYLSFFTFLFIAIGLVRADEKPIRTPASSVPQTNVVLILIDDLGWSDLGCYGSTYYRTPNID
jgi:hypothetical protein